jgi:Ice-binding-like
MRSRAATIRRAATILLTGAIASATFLVSSPPATAAIVATVPLATAGSYSVLGGQTVTNTGPSVLGQSLGLSPGTSITGFPPGTVLGTTDATNAAAAQAQSDLTAGYNNAAGRPVDATTTADLANLTLQGGVYAGPSHGALSLSGPLTLDGAGDPSTVFIFQTNSSLITASGSTVALINGAQECNVFWQVGSSATLGTGSTFTGNILALTSITVDNSVTVHGRALARNGAVTLDNDTFTSPSCATTPVTTTTTDTSATTVPPGAGTGSGGGSGAGSGSGAGTGSGPGSGGSVGSDVPAVSGPPRTGVAPASGSSFPWSGAALAGLLGAAGCTALLVARRPKLAASRR